MLTNRLLVIALAVTLMPVHGAVAAHNEPAKASAIKGALVTAYEPCQAAQITTSGGLPACSVPVRSNPSCGFASSGRGSFTASKKSGDVAFKVLLQGLEDACDGRTLQLRATVRGTLEDCAGTACSIIEVPKMPLATCVVDAASNRCTIKTSMNTVHPGTVPAGKALGIELLEFDIFDAGASRPTFRAGLFLP